MVALKLGCVSIEHAPQKKLARSLAVPKCTLLVDGIDSFGILCLDGVGQIFLLGVTGHWVRPTVSGIEIPIMARPATD